MTTPADHAHAFTPDGLTDHDFCVADDQCLVTYGEYKATPTVPTTPGPTGPLPRGWHRLRWTQDDKPRYVVSTDVGSIVALYSTLQVVKADRWGHITELCEPEYWQPGAPA